MIIFQTNIVWVPDLFKIGSESEPILATIVAWNHLDQLQVILVARNSLTPEEQKGFDGIAQELLAEPFTFFKNYLQQIHQQEAKAFIEEVVDHFTYSSIHSYGWCQENSEPNSIVENCSVLQPRKIEKIR